MDKNYPVIINMNSGTAQKKYNKIKGELNDKFTFKVKKPKEFEAAYKKILELNPKVVVLAGGDGTIIKGIESLIKLDYTGKFGILPFGTANYLARDLGIPLAPTEALERAKTGKPKKVPLAKINDNLFALMMTIGVTRAVSSNVSDELKQKIGQLAYLAEFFKQSKEHEAFKYEIVLNHKTKLRGTTHQLLVYNADLNQQLKLTPKHKLTSGGVKLLIARTGRNVFKLYFVFLLHILSFGKLRRDMKVYNAKHLLIKTTPNLPTGLDGEIVEGEDYTITADAEMIEVIS